MEARRLLAAHLKSPYQSVYSHQTVQPTVVIRKKTESWHELSCPCNLGGNAKKKEMEFQRKNERTYLK
jgi:hypothetical protein